MEEDTLNTSGSHGVGSPFDGLDMVAPFERAMVFERGTETLHDKQGRIKATGAIRLWHSQDPKERHLNQTISQKWGIG